MQKREVQENKVEDHQQGSRFKLMKNFKRNQAELNEMLAESGPRNAY